MRGVTIRNHPLPPATLPYCHCYTLHSEAYLLRRVGPICTHDKEKRPSKALRAVQLWCNGAVTRRDGGDIQPAVVFGG